MKKTIRLIHILDNLNNIPRTGGVLFGAVSADKSLSIAEHSYSVLCLVYLLGEIAQQHKLKISFEKVIKAALVHDWSDGILLDVPSGSPSYQSYFKGVNYRKLFNNAESLVIKEIERYIQDEIPIKLIKKEDLTNHERSLIQIADLIALLMEILNWKYQGLKYEWFDYIWANTLAKIEETIKPNFLFLKPLVSDLEKVYDSGIRPLNPLLTKLKYQSFKKK